MSTRGLYGFRKNGKDKTSYNHMDSGPEYLGASIIQFCATYLIGEMNELCDATVMVYEDEKPNEKELEVLKQYKNAEENLDVLKPYENISAVGQNGQVKEWYDILRPIQGNLNGLNDMYERTGTAYMTDGMNFIQDSLFCEHAYIINLDTKMLEYWIGFQKEPDEENRYGQEKSSDNYYPCRLVCEIPLADIYRGGNSNSSETKKAVAQFVSEMKQAVIVKNNSEALDDLVELIESNDNWSAEIEEDDTILLTATPEASEQEFAVDLDPDMDVLIQNIIDELDNYDEDDFAFDAVYSSSCMSLSDIRYVCDVAEEITEMCEELIDCLRREYVYSK